MGRIAGRHGEDEDDAEKSSEAVQPGAVMIGVGGQPEKRVSNRSKKTISDDVNLVPSRSVDVESDEKDIQNLERVTTQSDSNQENKLTTKPKAKPYPPPLALAEEEGSAIDGKEDVEATSQRISASSRTSVGIDRGIEKAAQALGMTNSTRAKASSVSSEGRRSKIDDVASTFSIDSPNKRASNGRKSRGKRPQWASADGDQINLAGRAVGAIPIGGIAETGIAGSFNEEMSDLIRRPNYDQNSHVQKSKENSEQNSNMAIAVAIDENIEDIPKDSVIDQNIFQGIEVTKEEFEGSGCAGFVKRNIWMFALVSLLLVIALVCGIYFGIQSSGGTENICDSVLDRASRRFKQAATQLLERGITTADDLCVVSPFSPQYTALSWLADEDEAAVDLGDWNTMLQRYVLAVFYYATNGDNWKNGYDFTAPSNECEWGGDGFGVTACDEDGFVTAVVFDENNINGTIPSEVGQMTMLNIFSIARNDDLSGTIPSTIFLLTSLQFLALERLSLTGTIPTVINQATSLNEIRLTNNFLTGSIPSTIGSLTLLSNISLQFNALSGKLPTQLGALSNLELLFLERNALTGTIPLSFLELVALRQATFSFNQLTGNADNLCNIGSGELAVLELDCFEQPVPAIIPKVECSCCTSCCSEAFGGCVSG